MRVWQRRPLYDADDEELREVRGEAGIENHYPLYLR